MLNSHLHPLRLRSGWLLAAVILLGLSAGTAQAENGEGQAPPNETAPTTSNEPSAETQPQTLFCMWRNKGVTGFCAVEPETPVGSSCACREVIEHKARKFSGKVIVPR